MTKNLEWEPRVTLGTDHGMHGHVLIRSPDGKFRLVWRLGHMSYIDRMSGNRYISPALEVFTQDDRHMPVDLLQRHNWQGSKRLSKAMLIATRLTIDAVFGDEALNRLLDNGITTTVVVTV